MNVHGLAKHKRTRISRLGPSLFILVLVLGGMIFAVLGTLSQVVIKNDRQNMIDLGNEAAR